MDMAEKNPLRPIQPLTAQRRSAVRGDDVLGRGEPGWLSDRSCCCPSQPMVRVVMPANPDRDRSIDLLLCGHHFRASRDGLAGTGAVAYDRSGALLPFEQQAADRSA